MSLDLKKIGVGIIGIGIIAAFSGCVALVPLIQSDDQSHYEDTCTTCKALQANRVNYSPRKSETREKKVDKLIKQLQTGTTVNKAHAAYWLGELHEDGVPAVPALISSLGDKSYWVRRASAKALGKIRDGRAKNPLRVAMRDKDRFVAEAARKAYNEVRSL